VNYKIKTAYERAKATLDASIPEYIKKTGLFNWAQPTETGGTGKPQNWKITAWKKLPHHRYKTCANCGKKNIRELFYVTNEQNETRIVGNECIKAIHNPKIATWFKTWLKKKQNLETNKNNIDVLDGLLERYRKELLPDTFWLSPSRLTRLQKMLDRMCEGLNPTKKQLNTFHYYIKKVVEATEETEQ
jgi:hypothetical protein